MSLVLTDARWKQLRGINSRVNRDIRYVTDMELYGKRDYWTIVEGVGQGDCEDYALTKQFRLKKLLWPASSLRIATCWVETKQYHAVLTVDTNKGTYVLDNRYKRVMAWGDLPYRWHKRQKPGEYMWENIG